MPTPDRGRFTLPAAGLGQPEVRQREIRVQREGSAEVPGRLHQVPAGQGSVTRVVGHPGPQHPGSQRARERDRCPGPGKQQRVRQFGEAGFGVGEISRHAEGQLVQHSAAVIDIVDHAANPDGIAPRPDLTADQAAGAGPPGDAQQIVQRRLPAQPRQLVGGPAGVRQGHVLPPGQTAVHQAAALVAAQQPGGGIGTVGEGGHEVERRVHPAAERRLIGDAGHSEDHREHRRKRPAPGESPRQCSGCRQRLGHRGGPDLRCGQRLKQVGKLLGGLVPVRGVLGQRLAHQGLQLGAEGRTMGPYRLRLLLQVLRSQPIRRGGPEGGHTGQHLVQHTAEAVDVAAAVNPGAAAGLLGTHVCRCPDHPPDQLGLIPAAGADSARHAEVGHHRLASQEQDVVWLDVPMHNAQAVGVGQRARHLGGDLHRVVHRQRTLTREPLCQVFTRHVRHDIVQQALGLAGIVDGQDVGMGQAGGDLDLSKEPVLALVETGLDLEQLERHLPLVLGVVGQVDHSHPAPPQLTLDGVAPAKLLRSTGVLVGHGCLPAKCMVKVGGWNAGLPPPASQRTQYAPRPVTASPRMRECMSWVPS